MPLLSTDWSYQLCTRGLTFGRPPLQVRHKTVAMATLVFS